MNCSWMSKAFFSSRKNHVLTYLVILFLSIIEFSESSALRHVQAKDGTQCPQWVADYSMFHRDAVHLHSDPDTRFLVWTCGITLLSTNATAYTPTNDCNGIGDRLRGIMWALRAAAASGRVLLVLHDLPMPLEALFDPAHIDWRLPTKAMHARILSREAELRGHVRHVAIDYAK